MNFDEISMNIFDGVGRASCFPILTATSAMQELYYKPLLPWLENEFVLDLGDGTTVKPFDSGYAARMAQTLGIEGTEDELIDMFGVGCWKYDPEAATKLLTKAGLEKKDDGWYFNGEPFVINLTYLADTEAQAGRGVHRGVRPADQVRPEVQPVERILRDLGHQRGDRQLRHRGLLADRRHHQRPLLPDQRLGR